MYKMNELEKVNFLIEFFNGYTKNNDDAIGCAFFHAEEMRVAFMEARCWEEENYWHNVILEIKKRI